MRYTLLLTVLGCLLLGFGSCEKQDPIQTKPPQVLINKPVANATFNFNEITALGIDILIVAIDDVQVTYIKYVVTNSHAQEVYSQEILSPTGSSQDVRVFTKYDKFIPTEPGDYTLTVTAKDGLQQTTIGSAPFKVIP